MQTQKIYKVGTNNQLIDLNGETTNFEAEFKVVSKNNEPFEMAVINQTILDSEPNFDFKKIDNGTISGTVTENSGNFQNYYIVLRSAKPIECMVEINKKDVPQAPQPVMQPPPADSNEKPKSKWLRILVIVALIGLGIYAFYWYSNRKDNDDNDAKPEARMSFESSQESLSEVEVMRPSSKKEMPEPVRINPTAPPVAQPPAVNPILAKLKRLAL